MLPLDKLVYNAMEVVGRQTAMPATTKVELLHADEHQEYPKRDKPLRDGAVVGNRYIAVGFVYGSL